MMKKTRNASVWIWMSASLLGAACGDAGDYNPATSLQPHERVDERKAMVAKQLAARDIRDVRVLEAMRKVPRHLFIPEGRRKEAYEDHAVPIGQRQTISQPYIVGFMSQALKLKPGDRVLEIGTGSGYQAAILGELAKEVYTIEIFPRWANIRRRYWPGWVIKTFRCASTMATRAGRTWRHSTPSSSPPRRRKCRNPCSTSSRWVAV